MGPIRMFWNSVWSCVANLWVALCIVTFFAVTGYGAEVNATQGSDKGHALTFDEMRQQVEKASRKSPSWEGPKSGPKAAPNIQIAIIDEDLRNGGILGVTQGIQEAAKVIGWSVKLYDAGGTPEGRAKAASEALKGGPDGLILVGADANGMDTLLKPFVQRHVPIVGWHVGPVAGSLAEGPVAVNISTDPLEVARVTAMAAIVEAEGRAGVVIFTDSNFEIAMAKANAMAEMVLNCADCTLLGVRDIAISTSAETMPAVTRELLDTYGSRWNSGLAINDIYFDYAVPGLTLAGSSAKHVRLLSAGDGSSDAFLRIQTKTFQTGTVAEPLKVHGWQLVDEMNRLVSGQPANGYIVPVHLVNAENALYDGGASFQYDPENGYRDVYRRIWGK